MLWIVWLGCFAVILAHTDYGYLGLTEWAALFASIGVTVWLRKHAAGGPKVIIRSPEEMLGEFASRPSWPWILINAWITLGGIAFVRLVRDLSSGFATPRDVLNDVVAFFSEWLIERLSGGVQGDVTNTRLYVMVVLLPLGLLMLLFNLMPLIFRGCRFRVETDDSIRILRNGVWKRLNPRDYARVEADGITINFANGDTPASPNVSLPQYRVYSIERGTKVADQVIAGATRQRVESAGMHVESDKKVTSVRSSKWTARRAS